MSESTPAAASQAATTESLGESGIKALQAERDARKAAEKELAALKAASEAREKELTQQLSEATTAKKAAEAAQLRASILISKQVPERLAGYVTGATKEELEACADKVLTDFAPPQNKEPAADTTAPLGPRPDMTQGTASDIALNSDALTQSLTQLFTR